MTLILYSYLNFSNSTLDYYLPEHGVPLFFGLFNLLTRIQLDLPSIKSILCKSLLKLGETYISNQPSQQLIYLTAIYDAQPQPETETFTELLKCFNPVFQSSDFKPYLTLLYFATRNNHLTVLQERTLWERFQLETHLPHILQNASTDQIRLINSILATILPKPSLVSFSGQIISSLFSVNPPIHWQNTLLTINSSRTPELSWISIFESVKLPIITAETACSLMKMISQHLTSATILPNLFFVHTLLVEHPALREALADRKSPDLWNTTLFVFSQSLSLGPDFTAFSLLMKFLVEFIVTICPHNTESFFHFFVEALVPYVSKTHQPKEAIEVIAQSVQKLNWSKVKFHYDIKIQQSMHLLLLDYPTVICALYSRLDWTSFAQSLDQGNSQSPHSAAKSEYNNHSKAESRNSLFEDDSNIEFVSENSNYDPFDQHQNFSTANPNESPKSAGERALSFINFTFDVLLVDSNAVPLALKESVIFGNTLFQWDQFDFQLFESFFPGTYILSSLKQYQIRENPSKSILDICLSLNDKIQFISDRRLSALVSSAVAREIRSIMFVSIVNPTKGQGNIFRSILLHEQHIGMN